MEIQICELKEVFDKLVDSMLEKGIDRVDLPIDFYWSISKDSRYDPYDEPKDLTMGQLSDDWSELRKIASDESPAIAYGMVWLAAILQAVGERLVR